MNFLAHVMLSSHDGEEMLGNLLGDFVRKGGEEAFSETMQRGIDRHSVFRRSRRRIRPDLRRFGGIAVDLFYDHFLALKFSSYHDTPLEAFAQRFYRLLEQYEPKMPPRLQQIIPSMIERNWLVSYREVDAIERSLSRISQRLSRPNALGETAEDLRLCYDDFSADFEEFFPELLAFTREQQMLLESGGCK